MAFEGPDMRRDKLRCCMSCHLCVQPMSAHPNALLTPESRQRLCPLAHVADAGGVSRTALTKWYKR